MAFYRSISYLCLLLTVCTCLNADDSLPSVTAPPVVEEEALPAWTPSATWPAILDAQLKSLRRARMLAGCKIAPLSELSDPEVLTFERNAETFADVDGLTPDAALAVDSLREMVVAAGGTFELKSAYRSTDYQAHLHEVWVKWVKELRNNRSTGCRALREEVGAEFARHQLLTRQQPVPASDHALGLAFDAAVTMPRAARLNGKRVTVDKLAAQAGTRRPTARRDPVHFTLIREHSAAMISAGPSAF